MEAIEQAQIHFQPGRAAAKAPKVATATTVEMTANPTTCGLIFPPIFESARAENQTGMMSEPTSSAPKIAAPTPGNPKSCTSRTAPPAVTAARATAVHETAIRLLTP